MRRYKIYIRLHESCLTIKHQYLHLIPYYYYSATDKLFYMEGRINYKFSEQLQNHRVL